MRHGKKRVWLSVAIPLLVVAGLTLLLIGCGAGGDTTPTPAGPTAQTLADAGAQVFAEQCATCHGDQGQGLVGPALLGSGARLDVYRTGQGLYDYTHTAMPQNAPGSLSDQQYLEVVTYLLLQNGYVKAGAPMDAQRLAEISLTAE